MMSAPGEVDPSLVWYDAEKAPPPIGVAVLVSWSGRAPFEASRVKHPRTGRLMWLTYDRGRPVFLPTSAAPPDPRRPWAGWQTLTGAGPDYWQPREPGKWKAALPAPAYIQTPSEAQPMTSLRMRFDAMSDAEAAEISREMQRDREAANAAAEAPRERERAESQWWLDPFSVTYSAAGAITMREVEGRLMRAFIAEYWVRVEWPKAKTSATVLANMAPAEPMALGELAAQDEPPMRIEANGRDRDDMLTALGWLQALPHTTWRRGRLIRPGDIGAPLARGEEALRLRGRTPPYTWRRIGKNLGGRSGESARNLYRQALAEVTAAANGRATPEVEAVRAETNTERARLEALRARKRQERADRRKVEA